jgi:hypothetical protein
MKKILTIFISTFFLYLLAFLFVNLSQIKPANADACTFTIPASVSTASNVPVVISGTLGHSFTAAMLSGTTVITQGSSPLLSPTPVTINLKAPATPGNYVILAKDNNGPTGCNGLSSLTVTIASGGGTAACGLGSNTVAAGDNLGFGYDGFIAGKKIFIWDGGANRFDLGTTLAGAQLVSFTIPSNVPPKSGYGGFIENGTNPVVVCGSLTVTAVGTGGGGSAGGAECTSFAGCTTIPGAPTPPGFTSQSFIVDLVSKFLPVALGLGGFLAIIVVVVSAIQFVTSNGNPDGAAAARGRLIFALVGFVLLILAFTLTKVIDTIFLKSGAV